MSENDTKTKKTNKPQEEIPGASGTSSWDFQVEEKTLIEAFKNDSRKEEREKQLKVMKQEKKLQLDYASQFKRKEKMANENAQVRIKAAAPKKPLVPELGPASKEKRLKSMAIDFVLLIAVFLLAGHFSERVLQSMEENGEIFCGPNCVKEVIAQVKWRVEDPALQKTIIDSVHEVESNPKLKEDILRKGMTYTFFLGLYVVCFSFPQIFFGFSLGKRITKIRVEHAEGGPINFSQGVWRESVCKLISLLTLIGPFMFLFIPSRRSLQDYMSNTTVADEPQVIKKK